MYFERLHIQGFKSFVDRTTIEFKPGITAIVGPNGCGKSNISDAIRWVLGEQNVRNLRGNRTEDLIFSGTDHRKPVGMAEVTLVVNSNGELPKAIHGQLEITRRVFRDGDSEFYINRVPCRLRDIVELFMDSGLGKGTYSMIEQGKVDLVLSSKPQDRRLLLEEAAGIVRYKARKEEALRKFADTQNNLVRVEDRLFDLENHAEELKKEARRARRFLREKEQLHELEMRFAAYQYRKLLQHIEETQKQIQDLDDHITTLQSKVSTIAARREQTQDHYESLLQSRNKYASEKAKCSKSIALAVQEQRFARERIDKVTAERKRLKKEKEELADKIDEVQIEYEEEAFELEETRQKAEIQEQLCIELKHQLKDVLEKNSELLTTKEEKKKTYLQLSDRHTRLSRQKEQHLLREREINNQNQRIQKDLSTAETALESLQPQKESHLRKIEESETALADIEARLASLDKLLREIESQENEVRLQRAGLQEKVHRSESRFQSLSEIEASREGYSSSLKFLLAQKEQGMQELPDFHMLMDLLTVAPQHQQVVGLALHQHLEAVVVSNMEDARCLAKLINTTDAGKLEVFVADQAPPLRRPQEKGQHRREQWQKEALQPILNYISCDPEYEPLFHHLLQHCYIVEDEELLFRLMNHQEPQPVVSLVAPQGSIRVAPFHLVLGAEHGGGFDIFSRKRELQELEASLCKLKERLHLTEDTLSQVEAQKKHLEAQHRHTLEEKQQAILHHQALKKDLEAITQRMDHYEEAIKTFNIELESLQLDFEANRKDCAVVEQEIEALNTHLKAVSTTLEALENAINDLGTQREDCQSQLSDAQVTLAELSGTVRELERSLSQRQEYREELNIQLEQKHQRIEETHTIEAEQLQLIEDLTDNIKEWNETLTTLDENLTHAEQALAESKARLKEADDTMAQLRQSLTPLHQQRQTLAMELKASEVKRSHLEDDVTQRLKSSLTELQTVSHQLPSEEEADKLFAKIRGIHKRLDDYHNVNLGAPQQYDAICQKLEEMNNQRRDIVEAIEILQNTIKKIDIESEKRFMECFNAVQQNFKDLFERLFGGGYAELQLDSEKSPLEAGVNVIARPPGKKHQSITLLSGGEKSLTAIALLVAIFYYRPSPFCFMDEVDAALDELNNDRFCILIREIAQNSQILLVTHRRKTIETADIFYGVTMADPGISKVISLKLNQETEQISA